METKMRIKLYDKEEEKLISDRLVEQSTELTLGPKEKHIGPLALEINLRSKEDIENVKTYLDKLLGNLPLTSKIKTTKMKIAKGSIQKEDIEPLEELMQRAQSKFKTQEDFITFLRQQGFRFITSGMITEGNKQLRDIVKLKPNHEKYEYLIRIVREAKDPLNDKYDPRLLIGCKLYGKKKDKVHVYLFGKFKETLNIPWKDKKKINFKKPEKLLKFPEFMDYQDRAKWRSEWRKVQIDPQHQPTKFYLKYEKFVEKY